MTLTEDPPNSFWSAWWRRARRFMPTIGESYVAGIATVLVVAVLAVLGGAVLYRNFFEPSAPTAPLENPFPNATSKIAVLGDSFASGEGARAFWASSAGCHRSWQTYAYTIATQYQLGLAFPACSGAVINDLDHPSSNALPAQIDMVRSNPNLRFVLVQIGGNNAHFGDLVAACLKANFHLGSPCAGQGFLQRLPQVESQLVKIYNEVRSAANKAPVFVLGYPNPFGPNYCTASEVTQPDWAFLSKTFIPQLDDTIARAAQAAHVHYVPMLNAFAGYGLCELPVGEAALNTISYLSNLPRHDSFHPNAVGQLLMANRIDSSLRANSINTPPESTPPNPATNGEASPVPSAAALPPQADSSPCHAGAPAGTLYPTSRANLDHIVLSGLLPASTVCYRTDGGAWQQVAVNAGGTLVVSAPAGATPSTLELIFQDRFKIWARSLYRVQP